MKEAKEEDVDDDDGDVDTVPRDRRSDFLRGSGAERVRKLGVGGVVGGVFLRRAPGGGHDVEGDTRVDDDDPGNPANRERRLNVGIHCNPIHEPISRRRCRI